MLLQDLRSLWSMTIRSGISDEGNLNFQRPLVVNLPLEVDSELNKRYSAINECLQ